MKYLCPSIIIIALLILASCGGSKSSGLPATQNAPKFSTAAANEYVKNLSQMANDYAAAFKARDTSKIDTLTPKLVETLTIGGPAAARDLTLDEMEKFRLWVNLLMQQVKDEAKKAERQNP